jgi:hypothetical protein
MRVIELTQHLLNVDEILNSAGMENIIIKVSDGREFVPAEVDSFDKEIGHPSYSPQSSLHFSAGYSLET